jgi:hypothetical protein
MRASASFGARTAGFLARDSPVSLACFLELQHGDLGGTLGSFQFA